MADLIQFRVSPGSDPTGHEVRALLHAHLAREQRRKARHFWVHALAFVGGLYVLGTLVPQIGPGWIHAVLLTLWGACSLATLVAAATEYLWQRREAHLLVRQTCGSRKLDCSSPGSNLRV
jgi:hypothetical protein